MKTVNLDLCWIDAALQWDGKVAVEIGAKTPGGISQKIKLSVDFAHLESWAGMLHKVVKEQDARMTEVKDALKGDL